MKSIVTLTYTSSKLSLFWNISRVLTNTYQTFDKHSRLYSIKILQNIQAERRKLQFYRNKKQHFKTFHSKSPQYELRIFTLYGPTSLNAGTLLLSGVPSINFINMQLTGKHFFWEKCSAISGVNSTPFTRV